MERRERGALNVFVVAGAIFATTALYPLSAGPVGWVIVKAGKPAWTMPIFEAFYAPAFWLQSHDRSRLLNAYYHWWWN